MWFKNIENVVEPVRLCMNFSSVSLAYFHFIIKTTNVLFFVPVTWAGFESKKYGMEYGWQIFKGIYYHANP